MSRRDCAPCGEGSRSRLRDRSSWSGFGGPADSRMVRTQFCSRQPGFAAASVWVAGREGGEIVFAEDMSRRQGHRLHIQRPVQGVDVAGQALAGRFRRERSGIHRFFRPRCAARGSRAAQSPRPEHGWIRAERDSAPASGLPAESARPRRKDATWPRACTPASVRPEPCGSTRSPVTLSMASDNSSLDGRLIGLDLPAAKSRRHRPEPASSSGCVP